MVCPRIRTRMSARAVARAAASTPFRGALAVARAALRWPRRSQWVSGELRGASEGGARCAWRRQGRLSAAAGAESGHGNSTRGSWRGARVRRCACDLRFAWGLMAIEWAPCRRTTRRDDGVVAGGRARAGRREVARKRVARATKTLSRPGTRDPNRGCSRKHGSPRFQNTNPRDRASTISPALCRRAGRGPAACFPRGTFRLADLGISAAMKEFFCFLFWVGAVF